MKTKKIDVCKFKLDSGRLVFYPGETLKGKLHLEMNRAMDMEEIKIICKGKYEVEWEHEYVDSEGNQHKEEYESKGKVFELKTTVFGNGGRDKHPAGEHDYPFSFELPKNLESSFEGDLGYIRYFLKVEIKKSWKSDLKMKKMFVINEAIDVNKSNYDSAPGDEDQKTLGCLCCASGPLILSANLNRSGFCGGQSILVNVTVGNNTSREMDDVTATLMQNVEYKAKRKGGDGLSERNDVNKIAHLKSDKIKEGETFTWKSKEMPLPPIVPNIKSKHITVTYYVEVHLDVPMGIDMRFKLPVTIGSIPYQPTYQEAETKENKHKPKCPAKIGLPPTQMLGYESMKPFQYSQLLNAKPKKMNKEEKEYEDNDYIPLYTFAMPAKDPSGSRSNSPTDESTDNMPPIQ